MKKIFAFITLSAFVHSMSGMSETTLEREVRQKANLYGVVEMLGRRPTMEDAVDVDINADHAFFAVYDGHNGNTVALMAKYNLRRMCQLELAKTDDEIKNALRTGFLKMQNAIGNNVRYIGSTATVAVIKNGKIFLANAGDSRAVLCNAGNPIALSCDHKPERPDEMQRIQQRGGSVVYDGEVWRVGGMLSVSRSLGDKYLYPYVIAEPELMEKELDAQDEFLIMACDGVWDVMKNEDAVQCARGTLTERLHDCTQAATVLALEAFKRGSTDNISAIVVNLKLLSQK
jgi:serine/threonine protein phosphatase PrpC